MNVVFLIRDSYLEGKHKLDTFIIFISGIWLTVAYNNVSFCQEQHRASDF